MKSGIKLIAKERKRQITIEGFDNAHDDDADHGDGEMADVAACYAATNEVFYIERDSVGGRGNSFCFHSLWPANWDARWDKRQRYANGDLAFIKPARGLTKKERIRNLTKAGALIAAEIDRLQRMKR